VPWLSGIAATCGEDCLEPAIRWLAYTVETEQLMTEIEDSTTRISTLVAAAKQYSQMDRAPYQVIDIHELLSSTLVMLARKIGDRVTVRKEYDRSLPKIPAYAAELNQVWTNLIDNALAAMGGSGTLTVRTSREDGWLQVEIGDTGPGIPEAIRGRVFEPFFTTNRPGLGHLVADRGKQASWRHPGRVRTGRHPDAGTVADRGAGRELTAHVGARPAARQPDRPNGRRVMPPSRNVLAHAAATPP